MSASEAFVGHAVKLELQQVRLLLLATTSTGLRTGIMCICVFRRVAFVGLLAYTEPETAVSITHSCRSTRIWL